MATPLQLNLLQLGFTEYEQNYAKKKTYRHVFPEEMEAIVPWDSF